jgi:hypothetical protein
MITLVQIRGRSLKLQSGLAALPRVQQALHGIPPGPITLHDVGELLQIVGQAGERDTALLIFRRITVGEFVVYESHALSLRHPIPDRFGDEDAEKVLDILFPRIGEESVQSRDTLHLSPHLRPAPMGRLISKQIDHPHLAVAEGSMEAWDESVRDLLHLRRVGI